MRSAPAAAKDLAGRDVRGFLDRDAIARIDQQPRDEVQRLLRSVDDHHLLERRRQPARARHVVRDRLAQRQPPERAPVAKSGHGHRPRPALHDAGPRLLRKLRHRRHAVAKVVQEAVPRRPPHGRERGQCDHSRRVGREARHHANRGGPLRARTQPRIGKRLGDERAGPASSFRIAFSRQLREGQGDDVARQVEVGGKRTGRWQL